MGRLDQEEVQYNEKIRNYVHRCPNLEEGRKAVIANFQNMFTNMGAEIVETKEVCDLAYAIEDFTKGYYVVMTVNSSIEAKTNSIV